MSSTVRMDEADKERLRRLQEAWERLRGERPSQKELLARGLAFLEEHQDAFLAEAAWTPLDDDEIDAIEDRARGMGAWSARDHDDVLYGSG
jgi:hypothetical protein